MRVSCRLTVAIVCLGVMSASALAGSQHSLAELLTQGYEIKATTYIPLQDTKAANPANASLTLGTMLVTLQKGPSIAVCTFGAGAWETVGNASSAVVSRADACDVP
jgi:hypothetical protein